MPADRPRVVGFFGARFERQVAAPFAGWEVLHDWRARFVHRHRAPKRPSDR